MKVTSTLRCFLNSTMLRSAAAASTMSQVDIIKNTTRFIVYDLETTGLGKKDQIVQLAAQNLYDASDYKS